MIALRQQCLVLITVWLTSFFFLWNIFCKIDVLRIQKRNTRHTTSNDLVLREIASDVSQSQESASRNNTRYTSKWFEQLSRDGFSLPNELRKLERKYHCNPVMNVLFLKTHKTGSSSITNIVNRFADLRELLVALPVGGINRFMWPDKFHWTAVDLLRLDGETANVLSNHARYNRKQMDLVMKKRTKYITILRDPVTQFFSSFYYFEFDKMLGLQKQTNPLEEFLKDPDKHLYDLSMRDGDLPQEMNLIQNGMFFDLGYDFLEFANETVVRNAIKKLETELDLVMIMEYFDESLVLVMRELCWSIDDILYIKMNQMKYKKKGITGSLKKKIRKWNSADVSLYDSFNRTLWRRIKRHGKEFWDDLAEFRRRNQEIYKICSPKEVEEKGFKLNVTVKGLVMNEKVHRYHRYYCQKMIMNEVQYLKYFRTKFSNSFGYKKILRREGLLPPPIGELRRNLVRNRKGRFKYLLPRRPLKQSGKRN